MEQTPIDTNAQPPETDALRSLYFLSHVNPEAGVEGLKDLGLAEVAVVFMEKAGIDIAPEYRERLERRRRETYWGEVEALIAESTYNSLTFAVYLAHEELNLEQLSIAWYAREEYELERELAVNEHGLVSNSDAKQYLMDEASIANRYSDPAELQIALELAAKGFEGIGPALLKHYQYRLPILEKAIKDNTNFSLNRELIPALSYGELQYMVSNGLTMHQLLYRSQAELLNVVLAADGNSEDSKTELILQAIEFYEDIVEHVFDKSANKTSRKMVLASKLVSELLKFDPESRQYNKWRRRLARHFSICQYGLITPGYLASDVEYALHSLGRPTTNDVIALMTSGSEEPRE